MADINLGFKPRNNAPQGPTAWEKFLTAAGLSESNCTLILNTQSQKGCTLRQWIEEHYATNYVPEYVLEMLNLHNRLNFK